jgi:predicted Zn-dependent peptidase
MTPQISTSKNGLRVLFVPNHAVETVNVMFLTSIGSRWETEKNLGIAHFLEHMAFKGTIKRPNSVEINREIELLGARTNAFTWQEYTGYWIMGGKNHLPKYLDILSDIYLNSTIPQEELDKEKGVILEEIKLHKDEPMYRASDLFFNATFSGLNIGRSVLGSEETIKNVTRADFLSFRNNYSPENTIIAVAGNTKLENILENLSEMSNWKQEKFMGGRNTESKNGVSKILMEQRKSEQIHWRLGIKSCDLFSPTIAVWDVLNAHIGQGLGSMMFETLREKMGVAYYCSSSQVTYTDAGALKLAAGVSANRLEESLEKIVLEIKNIADNGIGGKQLERAKEYIKGGVFMGMETTEGANEYYAFELLLKGLLESPEEYAKKVDAVSIEGVSRVLKENFKSKNISLAIVGDVSLDVKSKIENGLFNLI